MEEFLKLQIISAKNLNNNANQNRTWSNSGLRKHLNTTLPYTAFSSRAKLLASGQLKSNYPKERQRSKQVLDNEINDLTMNRYHCPLFSSALTNGTACAIPMFQKTDTSKMPINRGCSGLRVIARSAEHGRKKSP